MTFSLHLMNKAVDRSSYGCNKLKGVIIHFFGTQGCTSINYEIEYFRAYVQASAALSGHVAASRAAASKQIVRYETGLHANRRSGKEWCNKERCLTPCLILSNLHKMLFSTVQNT